MLEKIKQLGLEKFAGDETLAAEFVAEFVVEFVKEAALMDARAVGNISSGLYKAVGAGLGGLLVGAGIHGVSSAMKSAQGHYLHEAFEHALSRALSENSVLREANPGKVRQYAETIFKFAPNVAADPNLLQTILANAIHGQGIDPMTMKTLTDLESQYARTASTPAFSPKTYA